MVEFAITSTIPMVLVYIYLYSRHITLRILSGLIIHVALFSKI
jgi:hypothetical protein